MVSAGAEEAVLSAEEEYLEGVEEADIFAESEAEGAVEAEAVGAEGLEEDLWSLEDIPVAAEGLLKNRGLRRPLR